MSELSYSQKIGGQKIGGSEQSLQDGIRYSVYEFAGVRHIIGEQSIDDLVISNEKRCISDTVKTLCIMLYNKYKNSIRRYLIIQFQILSNN